MKLAFLFLLCSIFYVSVNGTDDWALENAKMHVKLFEFAVTKRDDYLLRNIYYIQPDNKARIEEIYAEYKDYELIVKSARHLTTVNQIIVNVIMVLDESLKERLFLLAPRPENATYFKIVE